MEVEVRREVKITFTMLVMICFWICTLIGEGVVEVRVKFDWDRDRDSLRDARASFIIVMPVRG